MTTLALIHQYVTRVSQCISLMRKHFGVHDLLSGVREGRIPKRGVIGDSDLAFSFHGIGCTIDMPDGSVEFDFGPNGDVGGFDAYRLTLFAQNCSTGMSEVTSEDEVRKELSLLQNQGIVIAPGLEPSPSLFYLRLPSGTS